MRRTRGRAGRAARDRTTRKVAAGIFAPPAHLHTRWLDTPERAGKVSLTILVARTARSRSVGRTGNSGENPGRPRRCVQAPRPVASGHCVSGRLPDRQREKACGRRSLGVRRPTRVREFADLRGRGGGHGRANGRWQDTQDPYLTVRPESRVSRAQARGTRPRDCACGAAVAWTHSLPAHVAA